MTAKDFKHNNIKISPTHTVSYFEGGTGKTIVLLPSLWLSSRSYFPIAVLLASNYRVLLVDLFRGASTFHSSAESISKYAEALKNFLVSAKIHRYFLLSFSLSGIYSTYLTQNLSPTPEKLLLVSSTAAALQVKHRFLFFCEAMIKIVLSNLRSIRGVRTNFDYLIESLLFVMKHPAQYFAEVKAAVGDHQIDTYKVMKVPTKLIVGNRDEFIQADTINRMKSIRQLEIEIIDANHDWFIHNPSLLVAKVKTFFG